MLVAPEAPAGTVCTDQSPAGDARRRGQRPGRKVSPLRPEPSIAHVDLDAFFASVEQRDKPSLAGRPVVVAGGGARGVVSAASYEARAFGVHSAMAAGMARALAPAGTAFLGVRMAAYKQASAVVMDVLRAAYPLVEQVSIDEAYIDLAAGANPGVVLDVTAATAIATSLQVAIAAATGGLSVSVGVGTSKLMAKVASDLRKPGGVTVVAPGCETATLWPLPVSALGGVGPATATRLRTLGVHTIGDLARVDVADLVALLGAAAGGSLHASAHGRDDREVIAERDTKSVSTETTFETDVSERAVLAQHVTALADRVGARLAQGQLAGRTVTLKVRRSDFSTITRSSSGAQPTDDAAHIGAAALALLAGVETSGGVRLLGVGVSGLAAYSQPHLFSATADAWGQEAGPEQAGTSKRPGEPAGAERGWACGMDVTHAVHGPGWIWGAGRRHVSVRFEGPGTPAGPVRTFAADDPDLHPAPPPGPSVVLEG